MFQKAKYLPDTAIPQRYAERVNSLPGHDLPWLSHRRHEALQRFSQTGYPTTTLERWRFSNVKPILNLHDDGARPHQGDICDAASKLDALPPGPRLVFVNGVYNSSLSTVPQIPGAEIQPLTEALAEHGGHVEAYLGLLSAKDETHGFAQLNLAFACDGLVVRLEEGVKLEQPIAVAHIYSGGTRAEEVNTRNLFILKEGAEATVVEYDLGLEDAVYTANTTTEFFLDGAAVLHHVQMQAKSAKAAHLHTRYIQQEQDSQFHGFVATRGARLSRIETRAHLIGKHADCNLHTVQLLRHDRHGDSTTEITHDTVGATSNQHCRMILDDHANGAFQGKTTVVRDAQQTDAQQMNKNLLLSRDAHANIKPELEIYADDVKCSHGATSGELSDMALFYLMARGIDADTARQLLVEAFAAEAIDEAKIDGDIKEVIRAYVQTWMDDD